MIDSLPQDFRPQGNTEIHEFESSIAWFEDSIFFIHSLPNVDHTIEHAIAQTQFFEKHYFSTTKCPMICDVRTCRPIKKPVRDYYSSPEGTTMVSQFAFLIESPFSKVVANFFITIKNSPIEIKMFNSTTESIAWCKLESKK